MKIGAMNHPAQDVLSELRWMSEMELDFVDLTLEPPAAATWQVDPQAIADAVRRYRLDVVGHTAYYLPLASPFEEVRQAAVGELKRCMEIFAAVGAKWMNLHPDQYTPLHDHRYCIQRNLQSLRELLDLSRRIGVGLMIENLPGAFNTPEQLGELLDPLPELGLHLDVGHANLQVPANTTPAIIAAYGKRLRHVHLHDNRGGSADLHLPLGTGLLKVPAAVRALKAAGYDATITLEVFTEDRHYLAYSRDVLRRLWDQT